MPSNNHTTIQQIETDPEENAIIVEYTELGGTETRSKKLLVGDLQHLNDVASLAKKIVKKYNYIGENWIGDVEDALITLYHRAHLIKNNANECVCSDEIEKSLELLYGSADEKLHGINKILALCQDLDALECLIQNHQLMSALTRLFGEDDLVSEMSFAVSKLFFAFSMIIEFHEMLSKYRVGSLTLRVIELEIKRAFHRGNPQDLAASSSVASPVYSYKFTNRQKAFLSVCCSILCHIADDYSALRKMIKKSLVTTLSHCLEITTPEPLESVLRLFMKASVFEDTAVELSSGELKAIEKLVSFMKISIINEDVVRILFNLSFHNECANLISSQNIHSQITRMLRNKSTRAPAFNLAYHLSSIDCNRNKLVSAGIASALVEILRDISPHNHMEEGLAGLLVNMTLNPLCVEEMMPFTSEVVATVLRIVQKSNSHFNVQVLLKVLRNMSQWTKELQYRLYRSLTMGDVKPLEGWVKRVETYWSSIESNEEDNESDKNPKSIIYWEHRFWDAHIDFILQSTLHCEDDDLLVEWIGILTNITKDDMPAGLHWHDLLMDNNCKIVQLCQRILESKEPMKRRDDLKLEVIIWLGELCANKECSHWIASSNLIDTMHDEFIQCAALVDGSEYLMLQLLLSYKQFILYEETRFQVIGESGVVEAMLSCLTKGHVLKTTAEECLVLIEDFDRDQHGALGPSGMTIQCQRYEALVKQIN